MRRAIVDCLQTKPVTECIAGEGDLLEGGVVLAKVLEKSVVLRDGGVEEELFLVFGAAEKGATAPVGGSSGGLLIAPGEQVLFTNRFGACIGEGRYVMSRDSLLAYAGEMKESPARIEKLFDSMVSIRGPAVNGRRGPVVGHQLKVVGEKEFYDAVGLREGDIVRKVNGEPVSSRQRAERLINTFLSDKQSKYIFDIERNGTPTKIEYSMK